MMQEVSLKELKAKRFDELVTLVNALLTSEHKHLSAPIRFARTKVRFVTIKISDKSQTETYSPGRRKFNFDGDI